MTSAEVSEILSYLPDCNGKVVVELGAGTGNLTSELAKKADKVIAIDNSEDLISKNKEVNQHLENVVFTVSDVTKLNLDNESVDIIVATKQVFTLEDNQVQSVFQNFLSWLRPDGYLFFVETSKSKSDVDSSGHNIPIREIEVYEAFYSSVSVPCDSDSFYGFDLVLSRTSEATLKEDGDCDMIWLLEKVKKDNSQAHGFQSFREFLDKKQYSTRGILLYEKIFGRTFVSTGGIDTTKEFLQLLNLQKGQKVLDVGGGIGGGAFYMAKTYGVKVVSVDLSFNMTQIGLERAKEVGCGPDQVVFEIADATKREYPVESFDVVYSRDVILHIADKLSLFKKFFKCLKSGGKVLISDYCCSPNKHSDLFKAYVQQRGYNLLSPAAYGKVLEEAGFINVKAEDKTQQFADILKIEIERTESNKEEFIKQFDEDGYNYIVDGWKEKLVRVELGDQRWGLFYAEKP
uniref:phosphoethanolamine N-methyltransferase n=1 Tax=Biomphalaria glabrata TaxID=6526 RepID=A0A2C9L659_BIOGL